MRHSSMLFRVIICTIFCLLGADAGAQSFRKARTGAFGQEIPPFLRKQAAPQTVRLGDRHFTVPDYSLGRRGQVSPGNPVVLLPFLGLMARSWQPGLAFGTPYRPTLHDATAWLRVTPNPLTVTEGLRRTPNGPVFDFTKTNPHLAFFCRLEINVEAGGIIPAKFRLGGHRYWQDNLLGR